MNDIIAFAAFGTAACFIGAFYIAHRSKTSMTPKPYTILSPMGQHASVVLFPQPYGKGIDREGNEYRITGETATPINQED